MAIKKIYDLSVDLKRTSVRVNVPVLVQGDSAEFRIRLLDNGAELSTAQLTGITAVKMQSGYDAQTVIQTVGALEGSVAVFRLQKGELFRSGTVQAMVQLEDADDRISTLRFQYQVIPDLEGNYVPGEQDVTIFQRYISDAQKKIDDINAAAEELAATDVAQLTVKLAEKGEEIKRVDNRRFYSDRIVKHNKRRPLITILDDDTRKELYTKLHPIMIEYGLPYTSAVVTGRIGTNNNTITQAEYDEILSSGLVEFISHTKNHVDLTTISLEQAEMELKESKEWVLENGGNPDYFVTPFGMTNPDTLRLMRKYYKAAFRTDDLNYLAKPPLTTFDVARSDFEKSVAVQKARIDNTIANNGWLIINTHAAYASFTESNFREVIDYALLKGLEFVTIGEGMQAFGNLIDIADNGTSEYGGIDSDGVAFGVLAQKYPVRESLQTGTVVINPNSNAAALVTPTKMTLVNSKVYMLTPTANIQGVVYTWSIDTSGRIVFRFNNLTASEKSLILTFTIAEVLSTT